LRDKRNARASLRGLEYERQRTVVDSCSRTCQQLLPIHLVHCADIELRPRGIAVSAVHPGFVRTPAAEGVIDPMPFILDTETAVTRIVRAIDRERHMTRFPWPLRDRSAV
jgi:NAD(P)-dependent dehydrogenase (short-subunit alcohol dehydrogenase family)